MFQKKMHTETHSRMELVCLGNDTEVLWLEWREREGEEVER